MTLKDSALRLAVLKALRDAVAAEEQAARAASHADMLRAADELGVKSVDVALGDGTKVASLTLAGGGEKAAVTGEPAFLAWVAEHHPSEVETVRRVRPAFTTAVLGAGGVVAKTGEVPDGVDTAATGRYVSVRYTPDGREAIARAWQAGQLAAITPYPELLEAPPEPDDPQDPTTPGGAP